MNQEIKDFRSRSIITISIGRKSQKVHKSENVEMPNCKVGPTRHTGFPIKDARLLKYFKSILPVIIPSLSSLSLLGMFFTF